MNTSDGTPTRPSEGQQQQGARQQMPASDVWSEAERWAVQQAHEALDQSPRVHFTRAAR